MATYTIFDKPLKVSGVPFFEENKNQTRKSIDKICRVL